jgi:hypothetical protein
MAADATAGRTFRSGVLCRADAETDWRISLERVFDLAVRAGPRPENAEDRQIWETIHGHAPWRIPVRRISAALPRFARQDMARRIYDGIQLGWVLPGIEPVEFDVEPPDFPKLSAFRLECARRRLPLVDIWHQPCSFPAAHYQVLAAMDGALDQAGLERFSKDHCPELAFRLWLRHLAGRGIFA